MKLYDPKGQQIEVGVSNLFVGTSGSLGASSGKSGQPTWSTVLEKAVIKWFQAFRNTSDIGGIGSEYAAAIITGNGSSFAFAPEKLTPAELQRAVSVSLKRGKLVVGGFIKAMFLSTVSIKLFLHMLIPCLCLWMIRCFSSCVIHGVQCLLLVVDMTGRATACCSSRMIIRSAAYRSPYNGTGSSRRIWSRRKFISLYTAFLYSDANAHRSSFIKNWKVV